MTWKENRPLFGGKARGHSIVAKRWHRNKKIKQGIKTFLIRKGITSVVGLPDVTDIIEEMSDKKD